jgi:DNA-binding Lrp family transcriptional regulator
MVAASSFPLSRLDAMVLNRLLAPAGEPGHGLDPMLPLAPLAEAVGASRNTVHAHIATWRSSGFLRRFVTVPHPQLFAHRLTGVVLSMEGPPARRRLEKAIEFAGDVFVYADLGPYSWLVFLERGRPPSTRWQRFLESLEGVRLESPFLPIALPRARRVPGRFDWRLLAELRATPAPRTLGLARALGVSQRTVLRHYHALLAADDFLAFPVFDYSRIAGAVLYLLVELGPGASPERVAAVVARADAIGLVPPPTLPRLDGDEGSTREGGVRLFGAFLYATSAATAADLARAVQMIPSVLSARIGYPGEPTCYPQAFDRLLESATLPPAVPSIALGRTRPPGAGRGTAPIPRSTRRRTARA